MFEKSRRSKKEQTSEYIGFSIPFYIGIGLLILIIILKNELIFSVGLTVIFYTGCNVFIRNYAKPERKEQYSDMLESAIFSIGIMYILKLSIFKFIEKGLTDIFSSKITVGVIMGFLLYGITILLFVIILYVLFRNGDKRKTHWSTHEQEREQIDIDLLEQRISMEFTQKNK